MYATNLKQQDNFVGDVCVCTDIYRVGCRMCSAQPRAPEGVDGRACKYFMRFPRAPGGGGRVAKMVHFNFLEISDMQILPIE